MPSKFDIFPDHRYISVTQAELACRCMFAWKCRYEDKVKVEPSRAMLMGRAFDAHCEGVPMPKESYMGLTGEDYDIIEQRYTEYKPHLPQGTAQWPFWFPLNGTEWWVRGFIDLLPDDPKEPFREIKLAQGRWKLKKVSYNRPQIITYERALEFKRPGQFDVSNVAVAGLQIFRREDYLKKGQSLEDAWKVQERAFKKAVRLIDGSDRTHRLNVLCKGQNENGSWECDYYDLCPERAKERELKEIANEYF